MFLFRKESVRKGWMEKTSLGESEGQQTAVIHLWAETWDSLKSVRLKRVRRWRIGDLTLPHSSHRPTLSESTLTETRSALQGICTPSPAIITS